MTCIVGFADGKRMILAGDAAGTNGLDIVIRKDPKVFAPTLKFISGIREPLEAYEPGVCPYCKEGIEAVEP